MAQPPQVQGGDSAGLVGAGPTEDRRRRLPENLQVESEGPILDITQIQPDRFIPRQVRPPADLPQAGHARLDHKPPPHVIAVHGRLRRQRRPRSDQRHVPEQHVEQLGKFIQRPAAQPGACLRHPRVPAHLEECPGPLVAGRKLCLPLFCVHHHGPELPQREGAAILPDPGLPEEDGPMIGELDGERDDDEQGDQHDQRRHGRCLVEHCLENPLAPAEFRVIHVQQRQPGDGADGRSRARDVEQGRRDAQVSAGLLQVPGELTQPDAVHFGAGQHGHSVGPEPTHS